MKSIQDVIQVESGKSAAAAAALGLVTVAFAVGVVVPTPASAQITWGTTYHNPDQTMYVCVCDGGDMCAPCAS
ncbi:MAG: hypothetical protein ACRDK3_07110 [Actinomycetota bacterium]